VTSTEASNLITVSYGDPERVDETRERFRLNESTSEPRGANQTSDGFEGTATRTMPIEPLDGPRATLDETRATLDET
jgi:hypothetical protein